MRSIGELTDNVLWRIAGQITHNVICVENWTAHTALFVWAIAGQLTHNVICVENWTSYA